MRFKQQEKTRADVVAEASEFYTTINGKQIIGHVLVKKPNEEAVTTYILEDNSEFKE